MNSFIPYVAPLALLLPAGIADAPTRSLDGAGPVMGLSADSDSVLAPMSVEPRDPPPVLPLSGSVAPLPAGQVRIEQTVTIRITPRAPASQQDILAQLPQGRNATRIEERKIGSCLTAGNIVGVQTGQDNNLLLFMRDRKVISAALEKACNAKDFYSGFYVERNGDGQLCVKRDKIHSRAGVKCELKQIRQLVAVRD